MASFHLFTLTLGDFYNGNTFDLFCSWRIYFGSLYGSRHSFRLGVKVSRTDSLFVELRRLQTMRSELRRAGILPDACLDIEERERRIATILARIHKREVMRFFAGFYKL